MKSDFAEEYEKRIIKNKLWQSKSSISSKTTNKEFAKN